MLTLNLDLLVIYVFVERNPFFFPLLNNQQLKIGFVRSPPRVGGRRLRTRSRGALHLAKEQRDMATTADGSKGLLIAKMLLSMAETWWRFSYQKKGGKMEVIWNVDTQGE